MKGQPNHFKRARQMFAAIAAAMSLPVQEQLAAMAGTMPPPLRAPAALETIQ